MNRKRPLATSILTGVLILLGSVLFVAGPLMFGFHISTEVKIHPFHRDMSVFLSPGKIASVLVVLGVWFFWTGVGLWRARRGAFLSGWGILGLFLVRGLLALFPPVETADVTAALWLIGPAILGMIVLSRDRSYLSGEGTTSITKDP